MAQQLDRGEEGVHVHVKDASHGLGPE
jgi:hypothetical protein